MKAHAILIGVSEVDERHYLLPKNLNSARVNVANAADYLGSLTSEEFKIDYRDVFIGCSAKWRAIKKRINYYKEKFREDPGLLIIYFSGHGYQTSINFKVENYLYCFYDQMIFGREIKETLVDFNRNSKLVLIADSCKSEGFGFVKSRQSEIRRLVESEFVNDYVKRAQTINSRALQYQSEICLIAASRKGVNVSGVSNTEMTNFTRELLYLLRQNSFDGNYSHLISCLNLKKKLKEEAIIKIANSESNYFLRK
ncbi:MAG: caspase family protein, partial [Flavobacteriales bacterium]|nr:caspase family protein [Flavobacteriales bacterium]